ncbi:hypothetical protein BZM27_53545 [Paraburkholderia steynii]|uniref:Intradiol ring-cleavage dioxygenases domain-containing protein n=1 Tax=Paraburkholderia steynii TaxID=1245441 RepID=A0A4V2NFX6_9BURK|nr:hypothetical protein BZM27_53545 [Paraburkholderia steynii]
MDLEPRLWRTTRDIILTPSQTSGPLFGFSLLSKPVASSVGSDERNAITVEGHIFDGQGKPLLLEALVEIWTDGQACLLARIRMVSIV